MLKVGLIGIGKFGKNYVRILQNTPDIELAAIAASSEKSLNETALSGAVKKTTDVEEIFRDSNIDAVVIATPTETHFALASSALKHGKYVLLEKPMTATLKEAEELAKTAKASRKILIIGHQYCYNDHICFLKEKIEEGFFGNILYIQAEHFYTRPLKGSIGCFWETATHELAILDYCFGAFSVESKQGVFKDFLNKGRDDFANVFFDMRPENSGAIPVSIMVSWCAPEKVRRFQIAGDKGAAVFDEIRNIQNPLRFYEKKEGNSYQEIPIRVNAKEPLQNEIDHFVHCVKHQKTPLTDGLHGLRVIRYLADLATIDK